MKVHMDLEWRSRSLNPYDLIVDTDDQVYAATYFDSADDFGFGRVASDWPYKGFPRASMLIQIGRDGVPKSVEKLFQTSQLAFSPLVIDGDHHLYLLAGRDGVKNPLNSDVGLWQWIPGSSLNRLSDVPLRELLPYGSRVWALSSAGGWAGVDQFATSTFDIGEIHLPHRLEDSDVVVVSSSPERKIRWSRRLPVLHPDATYPANLPKTALPLRYIGSVHSWDDGSVLMLVDTQVRRAGLPNVDRLGALHIVG